MAFLLKNKYIRWFVYALGGMILFRVGMWFFGKKKETTEDKIINSANDVILEYLQNMQDVDTSQSTINEVQAKAVANVIWNEIEACRWFSGFAFSRDNVIAATIDLTTDDLKLVLKVAGVKEFPPLFNIGEGEIVTMYEYANRVCFASDVQFLNDLFAKTGLYGV